MKSLIAYPYACISETGYDFAKLALACECSTDPNVKTQNVVELCVVFQDNICQVKAVFTQHSAALTHA